MRYGTLKYSPSGEQLWAVCHDGPSNLVVDVDGYAYVTTVRDWEDFATVKYSPSGEELWLARYASMDLGTPSDASLAVDTAGNVYVTGTFRDFDLPRANSVMVKYSPSGDELWVTHSPGRWSRGVAVSDAEGVYVEVGPSIATRKYDANGNLLWEAPSGLGTPCLAIDRQGNAYVAGIDDEAPGDPLPRARLIKYSASGEELWAVTSDEWPRPSGYFGLALDRAEGAVWAYRGSTEDGAEHLTVLKHSASGELEWIDVQHIEEGLRGFFAFGPSVDPEGNAAIVSMVLVGRGPEPFFFKYTDLLTVKYGPSGERLWEARYDGPRLSLDSPGDVAVGAAGNVYVVGQRRLIKYSPTGKELWAAEHEVYMSPWLDWTGTGPRLAVGARGEVLVLGASYETFGLVLLKYSSTGDSLWVARHEPLYYYAGPLLDLGGNACVVGRSEDPSGRDIIITLKYRPSGELLWEARYEDAFASELALDGEGNVHVAGYYSREIATVKYASSGEELWAARYSASSTGSSIVNALSLGPAGSVFVAGVAFHDGRAPDAVVVKYSAAGEEVWATRRPLLAVPDQALLVEDSGEVWLAMVALAGRPVEELTAVKYSADGEEILATRHDLMNAGLYRGPWGSRPHPLSFDRRGNLYLWGTAAGPGCLDDTDFVALKLDPAQGLLWTARYGGSGNQVPSAFAVDDAGNAYLTGGDDGDYLTVKFIAPDALPPFLRGQANGDASLDISDAVAVLQWLFLGAGAPPCRAAANANGDAVVDLSDAVWLLAYLFLGGSPPAPPFPACGPGALESDEALGCEAPPVCTE
ncbi:MAG: PQQ-binding-like beta-propeller repeat protein [Planctomycetes bacterium]|nr:PQQ-binding-like beta-propeller repeat protein [Planctomycetota bacterium]